MTTQRAAKPGQPQSEVNGHQMNGQLPPSTFAAQIVDNLASARRLSDSTDKQADLRQLLQMILDAERDGDPLSEAIETSIEVNYRLIYTIVRAGLEVLSSDNPFDNTRDVQVQALNTLAVVDLTIRRYPEVLFWVPGSNDPTVRPGGPLFLWLVPQLINLLSHGLDKEVSEGTANVLGTTLSVQTRASTSRIRLRPVLKYIRGCIKDLLFYVDAVQEGEIVPESFRVPTNDTVVELYRQFLEPERPKTVSSIKHDDLSQDIVIIVHLLLILLNPEIGKPIQLPGKKMRSNSDWVLDCLTRVWRIIGPGQVPIISSSSRDRCYSAYLKALCLCLEPASRYRYESAEMLQAAALLSDFIFFLLQSEPEELSFVLEIAICWSIYDLLAVGNRFSRVLEIYQERLGASILPEDGRRSYVDSRSLDLQRALALAAYYSISGGIQSPVTPSQQELLDFEDSTLRDAFHRILKVTNEQGGDDEPRRPHKRARLSDIETSSFSFGTAEMVIGDVYSILQLPLNSGLDEFDKSAA
ncbi:serine/threonine-protein kinase M1 [Xylographa opegraphella]|nr:serine/threonine-protein kinase M1 [Xylographa opegraphella]